MFFEMLWEVIQVSWARLRAALVAVEAENIWIWGVRCHPAGCDANPFEWDKAMNKLWKS